MEQLETTNKSDLIDRKKEKEIVKPYRKYQLIIILLILIMIIFCFILFSLNKELNYHIRENESLSEELVEENQKSVELDDLYNRVEVNYVSLYELDKELNIDIIRDLNELSMLTNFISKTSSVQFGVCYKASAHGDTAKVFQDNCSGLAPLVVLIETKDGYRFGAYTNVPFTKSNSYKEDPDAFLFSFDTKKMYKILRPESAIGDFDGKFPVFGRNDIVLKEGFFSNTNSMTECPKAYQEDPNAPMDYVLNGGIRKFMVKEVEILSCYIQSD